MKPAEISRVAVIGAACGGMRGLERDRLAHRKDAPVVDQHRPIADMAGGRDPLGKGSPVKVSTCPRIRSAMVFPHIPANLTTL